MNGEELETRVWKTWIQDLDNLADKTKSGYLRNFKRFLKRWGLTASEIYEMRKADIQSIEPMERKQIERMVKTSMSEIRKTGFSKSSARSLSKAVSSFFESMDMELHFKKKDYPRGEYKGQVVISKAQIVKMYDNMFHRFRLRNRAMLMFLKDSGLRLSDLAMMDYGDWLQTETILNEYNEIFKVFDPEETEKMKVIAYIQLGPESVAAIEKYLEYRQDRGEILTEESPLFISQKRERIKTNAMTAIFRRLALELKMKKVSAHSLRKFHRTNLEDAGVPLDWIKKLQGKAASVYSQPEKTGKLKKRYIECYDSLRIFDKPMDKGETERLREEVERLRAQSDPEISKLWTAYEDIQDTVVKIANALDIPV